MTAAFGITVVVAIFYGWMAARGSGAWWTGLAAGSAMFGLLFVVPLFIAAVFVRSVLRVDYPPVLDQHGASIVLAANAIAAWYAFRLWRSA